MYEVLRKTMTALRNLLDIACTFAGLKEISESKKIIT